MQNDKDYWEKQFSSFIERTMKLAQAAFFYKVFKSLFPEKLRSELSKKYFSCCDFGCGLGNFTNSLYNLFPNFKLYGIDYSKNAINYAKKNFPKVHFVNIELSDLRENYDVMVTSNTLEHFSNPEDILKKLLLHTKKLFVMLVPYEEYERYEEHFFTFEKSFFKNEIAGFELVFLRSVDLSFIFNTMWLGKQVLAVYKAKNFNLAFEKDVQDIHHKRLNRLDKMNYKFNLFRRNAYRCLRRCLMKIR